MPDPATRIKNLLLAEDEAAAAIVGERPGDTLSGGAGRAAGFGGGKRRWWGPLAVALIDGIPVFGRGHCQRTAEAEADRQQAWLEFLRKRADRRGS